jgi:type I restriction enzyme M protein
MEKKLNYKLKIYKRVVNPKKLIYRTSNITTRLYIVLIDQYDVYQHLMSWVRQYKMIYVIAADGWQAGNEVSRLIKKVRTTRRTILRKDVEGLDGLEGDYYQQILLLIILRQTKRY